MYKTNKTEEILTSIPVFKDKIDHISNKYGVTHHDLTQELVRFLDLVNTTTKTLSPSIIVDLAWHELILFTRFYQQFCSKHYNRFIHHTPDKTGKPDVFLKTIQLYVQHYGQPHPVIWGKVAQEEWELSNCGSCIN